MAVVPDDREAIWNGTTSAPVAYVGALYYLAYWSNRWTFDFIPDLERRPLAAALEEVVESIGTRITMWDKIIPEVRPILAFPYGHPFDRSPLPVLHQVA
ncbi:hypothetical protein [Streptomyces europaeiscabiei]|uniref:hypothetical protein n=1 Tax=Streptomyces europaeiscabiei TaxID=146819 RepID=UPI0029BC3C3C|nr:hypothetical protein [Streptomyces europaeiscabiei]MDX3866435.1 hypothetical protein [Streptomyces europaeiscabiei]MDX3873047.1 hypothetical protein [Streptomyces europaeiscabiei]